MKQLNFETYNNLQSLFSKPDFQSSSTSIIGGKIAFPSLCDLSKMKDDLLINISQETCVPKCKDHNGLWMCSSISIMKQMKFNICSYNDDSNDANNDNKYWRSLDISNVDLFGKKQAKLIHYLKCSRVIFSIGSGNGATELTCCESKDFIICLDISRRDLSTGMFCAKLQSKFSGNRMSRVVFKHFNLKNVKVIKRLACVIEMNCSIQPLILFQHPTPSPSFVENVFQPAIDVMIDLVVHRTVKKLIFVYDSMKECKEECDGKINVNVIKKDILLEKIGTLANGSAIVVGEELRLSTKGQEQTVHPLFQLHRRQGWAQMKRKDEYCFVISRR